MVRNGEVSKLSPKQLAAIQALLSNRSVADACKAAKIGRTTMDRWLKQEVFQAELSAATTKAIESIIRNVVSISNLSIDTLKQAMTDSATPPGVKVRAASVVLGRLVQLREIGLENRLSDLEATFEESKK